MVAMRWEMGAIKSREKLMHAYDRRRFEHAKEHPHEDRPHRQRDITPIAIRCCDCSEFFSIRERPNQGFRYHRCAECATRILAAKIKRGEALPVRVHGAHGAVA